MEEHSKFAGLSREELKEQTRELLRKLEANGVSRTKFMLIEGRTEDPERGMIYRPKADICNLFVPMVEAALNHMEMRKDDAETYAEIRAEFAEFLNHTARHREVEGVVAELLQGMGAFENATQEHKEQMSDFYRLFFMFSMIAFTASAAAQLNENVKRMIAREPLRYFALLAIWGDLSPEAQQVLDKEFKRLQIWE